MKKKILVKLVIIAIVVALGLAFIGCNKEESATESASSGAATEKSGSDKIVLGMPFPDMHDEALVAFKANLEKFAEENPREIEIRFTNADSDTTKQASDIKDLISQGVDVMLIMPMDSKAFSPSIQACEDAGIPTLGFAWPISPESPNQTDVFVGIDTADQGYSSMNRVFEKMKEDGVESTGVILVSGDLRNEVSLTRTEGVSKAADEWGVEILVDVPGNWDPLQAASGLAAALKAYPDANTVQCHSDSMLAGVQKALEEADAWYPRGHEKHMYFGSVDVFPAALDLIREDYIDANTLYDIVGMCSKTIEVLVQLADGKEFASGEKTILIKGPVYTSDNVDDSELQARLWN